MSLTVRSLLALSAARTTSLTPGVGEDRRISWAHVCELPEPGKWLGPESLLMTVGLAIPATTEEQCRYISGMHAAGIAAIAVDSQLPEHSFTDAALLYASHIGFPILQTAHEVPFVRLAQAIASSARAAHDATLVRAEQLHGSLLLAELYGGSLPPESAAELVAGYGLAPPYQLAAVEAGDARETLTRVHRAFSHAEVAGLATTNDAQVLVLTGVDPAVDQILESLADADTRIGIGAPFSDLDALLGAVRQARSALIRNHQTGNLLRFEEDTTASLFLPTDIEQLRGIAEQVLGPLRTYDEQRSASLTQTLRVFLEENRSWVRASERLFVHRQTLIARISRIEKIIDRDLASIEDTAECWLAVQAAIRCGDLENTDAA